MIGQTNKLNTMAKRRTTPRRKPPEAGVAYEYEGQALQLVKTKGLGCDGCFFDQAGRCLVGDNEIQEEFNCTINAGDQIFVKA